MTMHIQLLRAISFIFCLAFVPAQASIVTDQEQPVIDRTVGFLGVGGDSEQKLAQSFTVGVDGSLVGLRLPLGGCGRGSLVIAVRELSEGLPAEDAIRSVSIPAADVPTGVEGFHDYYFPTAITVSEGDILAFTVETVGGGSFCSFANGPVGDSYARGNGFFDARPNRPGWINNKTFTEAPQDLPFFTLMDADVAPGRSSDNCVAPGATDPSTGLPLELPITRFVPVCRCFEDRDAREFRCGVFHPDFFAIRRVPLPVILGQPYEETWQFLPVTQLDAPVNIRFEGAGIEQPTTISFSAKGLKSSKAAVAVKRSAAGQTETLKFVAPDKAGEAIGVAVFEYKMKDPKSVYHQQFGVDISLPEELYDPQRY